MKQCANSTLRSCVACFPLINCEFINIPHKRAVILSKQRNRSTAEQWKLIQGMQSNGQDEHVLVSGREIFLSVVFSYAHSALRGFPEVGREFRSSSKMRMKRKYFHEMYNR